MGYGLPLEFGRPRNWRQANSLTYVFVSGKHLILQTDPEKGEDEYAFDNPGFKGNSFFV